MKVKPIFNSGTMILHDEIHRPYSKTAAFLTSLLNSKFGGLVDLKTRQELIRWSKSQ